MYRHELFYLCLGQHCYHHWFLHALKLLTLCVPNNYETSYTKEMDYTYLANRYFLFLPCFNNTRLVVQWHMGGSPELHGKCLRILEFSH